jgi:hypothetical protein
MEFQCDAYYQRRYGKFKITLGTKLQNIYFMHKELASFDGGCDLWDIMINDIIEPFGRAKITITRGKNIVLSLLISKDDVYKLKKFINKFNKIINNYLQINLDKFEIGQIKFLKEYSFITRSGKKDIYFHKNSLKSASSSVHDFVAFQITSPNSAGKIQAVDVMDLKEFLRLIPFEKAAPFLERELKRFDENTINFTCPVDDWTPDNFILECPKIHQYLDRNTILKTYQKHFSIDE